MQHQRASLLLENGHIVIGWGSHCDFSPWHGWVMSYNAGTLVQEGAFNTSADGSGNGVWMGGGGLAADASGNIYFPTGNGTWNGTTDFGDSIIKLGTPSGGSFPVVDYFTPYNQSSLSGGDLDLGSGGLVLLPPLPSGQQTLAQMGKDGKIHLVDINNMGKSCVQAVPACQGFDSNIVQEIPAATAGVWGTPAYWNGSVYWGPASEGTPDNLKQFPFNANQSGLLSTSPASESPNVFTFSGSSPAISANGNSNGILWSLDNSAFRAACSGGANCQILYAYDATNLANMLYNSNQAPNYRDIPGGAVKFTTPTIANGKVYVGSQTNVTAYGLISNVPSVAMPTFSTSPGSYTQPISVTLSDGTTGATIYCTIDGTAPTVNSPVCGALAINSTTIVKAIAAAGGFNPSGVATGTFVIDPGATGPNYGSGFTSSGITLNGAARINGTRLRLTDAGKFEAGSAFVSAPVGVQNFTTDFSFQLDDAFAEGFTFTIQGVGPNALGPIGAGLGYGAVKPGATPGIPTSVAVKFDFYSDAGEGTDSTGLYLNGNSPTTPLLNMSNSGIILRDADVFNVHMTYDGTTLTMTITDGINPSQHYTAHWTVDIPATVGSNTAYVGFTGSTGKLSAIQEILNWTYVANQSTVAAPTFSPVPGYYSPGQTVTLADMTGGAVIHCTTDGTMPTAGSPVCTSLTLNTITPIQAIAVASGVTSTVASGTYSINMISAPAVNYSQGFSSNGLALNGVAALSGSRLRLTNGAIKEAGSAFFTTPVTVRSFTTSFTFQLINPKADGMAFVIQNAATTALGPSGGGLGYGGTKGIPSSVAVKFDLYNNSGEGPNSTGLYIDGAVPTIPAINLGGNVNLHSGDVFNVQMAYNGTTLTMTITDTSIPADTFTQSWVVNIPGTVGGNAAYVGFTGGSGSATAVQDVLYWTFTAGNSQ
jgi:hypothetical protein